MSALRNRSHTLRDSRPGSGMTTVPILLALESSALALSLLLLMVVVTQMKSRSATPADGLSISVCAFSIAMAIFRLAVLASMPASTQESPRLVSSRREFLISGYYIAMLWSVLHVGLSLARPSQPYFPLVSTSTLDVEGISNVIQGENRVLRSSSVHGYSDTTSGAMLDPGQFDRVEHLSAFSHAILAGSAQRVATTVKWSSQGYPVRHSNIRGGRYGAGCRVMAVYRTVLYCTAT